ncbi:uncharacterized protein [Argopecten irradians]|uniref:uncharacterized protein n=1 Tax=Argopecten irradians TaxID=31199 RepID=UPI0037103215
MATRQRGRSTTRKAPWDSLNPANWTTTQLREKLSDMGIAMPPNIPKSTLKNIYLENIGRNREHQTPDTNVSISRDASEVSVSQNVNSVVSDCIQSAESNDILNANVIIHNSSPNTIGNTRDDELLSVAERSTADASLRNPPLTQDRISTQQTMTSQNNMAAPTTELSGTMTTLISAVHTIQQTVQGLQTTVNGLINRDNRIGTAQATSFDHSSTDMTLDGFSHTVPQDDKISTTSSERCSTSLQSSTTISSHVAFESTIQELLSASIAPSTRRTYSVGFDKYIKFLLLAGLIAYVSLPNLPVSENNLIQFVAHCFRNNISYATIKIYICGIRFMCLENNIAYPFSQNMPRLQASLTGVKRSQIRATKPRLPITFPILQSICHYLRKNSKDPMMETVCVVAFFGFLRCGEFTVSGAFDPSIHLCINDLVVMKDCILLTLKTSKTDPFRKGVVIRLFSTNHSVCPYNMCVKYMAYRSRMQALPQPHDPLFVNNMGQVLTRSMFIALLKHTLECLNLDSSAYNGHSFRIGAATSASSVRMEDHMIKTLGRWSSDAYCRYIRTSVDTIKAAQRSMVLSV